MNILAVDAATEACSAALLSGDALVERYEVIGNLAALFLGKSGDLQSELHIFPHGEPREKRVLLEDDTALRARTSDRDIIDYHLTG